MSATTGQPFGSSLAGHSPGCGCGCCAGLGAETPIEVYNRPGLSAVAYRVGAQPHFNASMLAALTTSQQPALAGLTTRAGDDFSIALLDAWATVADVLTFYSERIANENYLRTATERQSILELARLIGYELRPGVAASAWLAFKLEETPAFQPPAVPGLPMPPVTPVPIQQTPGVPGRTPVPAGVKVQSTPGPGEQPQTFETVEAIDARVEWNTMRPRLRWPHPPTTNLNVIHVNGVDTTLQPGDRLLLADPDDLTAGSVKRVLAVTIDPVAKTTRLDLDIGAEPSIDTAPPASGIEPATLPPLTDEAVAGLILGATWRQQDLTRLALTHGWPEAGLAESVNRLTAAGLADQPLSVLAMRTRASLFGHNAPLYDSLPVSQRVGEWVENHAKDVASTSVSAFLKDDDVITEFALFAEPYSFHDAAYPVDWDATGYTLASDAGSTKTIHLDTTYPSILPGFAVALERTGAAPSLYPVVASSEVTRTGYAISAKVTRLVLNSDTGFSSFRLRETNVLAQSAALDLAGFPLDAVLSGNSVLLDRAYLGMSPGRTVIVSGERTDLAGQPVSEAKVVADVTLEDGYTRLTFTTALAHSYRLASVVVHGNVSAATHGETVHEVLGSGDAGRSFQRFTLRQPPLTHVSAPTPSGAVSTLQVRVNDILWHEVASFLGCGPDERVYITRRDDDGRTTVQFGDGVLGGRLPTGQENVRATYRRGIGAGGNVRAKALDLLLTRPQGIGKVENPLAAIGSEDPESLALARHNAPLTVLTLDRIVSLRDYEDFARAYAGIAKAHATWDGAGRKRGVLVTVAGPAGAEIAPGTPTYDNLLDAIANAGDPLIPVRLESYRGALFELTASIRRHPDYRPEDIEVAARLALQAAFAFETRAFNQAVSLSEVIALIQRLSGVVAVSVTEFALAGAPTGTVPAFLTADTSAVSPGQPTERAWLLTIDPTTLSRVKVTA